MLRWKTILIFILAVGISCFAAAYRFGDSAHAIGMLSADGGKARHPFKIKSGKNGYTLIMTGIVLPPYQGDVRIALEGTPVMNYRIYDSKPVIDLGIHRRPELDGNILHDVQSRDRLALWLVMKPPSAYDLEAPSGEPSDTGMLSSEPAQPDGDGPTGQQPLKLSFYAANSGQKLLQIPVVFADLQQEGGAHGSHH